MNNKFDILILGSIAGHDLILAEHLSRRGLHCIVARKANNNTGIEPLFEYHQAYDLDKTIYLRSEWEFLRLTRNCKMIISLTGNLVSALGKLWPLRRFLHIPPVINLTTGSDITELAKERSFHGWLYRQYLQYVDINWCANYPYALNNIIELRIPNVIFMRYPYYFLDGELPEGLNSNEENPYYDNVVRFFHPSNLDWKATDVGEHRNSSKGNDRFIKAFARAVAEGLDGYCVILDRGPDKELAKALIGELNIENRFIWKPHLTREELLQEYLKCDVVIDQFDVGGLGGIAVEAMSLGKPVMMYLEEHSQRILYSNLPPVLNAYSEEDIYCQLLICKQRDQLKLMGKMVKQWVYDNHHWKNCLDQFLFYYSLLTGDKVVKYTSV